MFKMLYFKFFADPSTERTAHGKSTHAGLTLVVLAAASHRPPDAEAVVAHHAARSLAFATQGLQKC